MDGPDERKDSHWADVKEIFEPVIVAGRYLSSLLPTRFRLHRPRFNFIAVHYCYMVGMAIVISVMLFPALPMAYIDALFFAAGCATQSGLNTIDVNKLNTYQQVVMMLMTCICTPIFINTAVVFIRLYWFEQRFEHVVKQIREQRRTRPRSLTSRSKSQMRDDRSGVRNDDPSQLESGVNGRRITVLRESLNPGGMNGAPEKASERRRQLLDKLGMDDLTESVHPTPESSRTDSIEEKDRRTESIEDKDRETGSEATTLNTSVRGDAQPQPPSTADTPTFTFMGLPPGMKREITFADEVPNTEGDQATAELARVPSHRDISKHVEFLERQQNNAKKGGALYIPGPRDFDRGKVPEELDHDMTIKRLHTRTSFNAASDRSPSVDERMQDEDHPKRGITINVPDHPAHRNRRNTDTAESPRKDDEKAGLRRRSSKLGALGERTRSIAQTWTNITSTMTQAKVEEPMPYFAWSATTGRNSVFVGLTAEQREDLGGIEYRSLKTLAAILLSYFFGFHILGMMVFLPWILHTQRYRNVVEEIGQSPGWWGVFTPASMFNDLGFTLTPDSMISFQSSVLALLFGSFLIIIGNTGFPCMLRFIIWFLSKIVNRDTPLWEELRFLLDHPRRCFTLLFPSKATWWLFWVLVLLNGIDLIFFIILDLNQAAVTNLHPGIQVLNGWFQACSTRTAGFASVNLADLHTAIQVSYLIMMYISIFPIAISVRRTNVYEEQSLGIFGGEEEAAAHAGDGKGEEPSYVSQHLRRQLSFDLWYIFLGLFIISIVEGDRIANVNDAAFTTFSVLFEIVSAYGTVGLSLGYPGTNASFSAQFRTISKLIIIAMMIRGRHRGLPYALDRAILLPSEKLQQKEAEASERRLAIARRGSMFAEGNENEGISWERGDLDNYGLPRQHTLDRHGAAGGDDGDAVRRVHTRRSTAAGSAKSGGMSPGHQRVRSLSRVVLGGLSAGPTFSKRD
jgi:potassium uptake Trk family protein